MSVTSAYAPNSKQFLRTRVSPLVFLITLCLVFVGIEPIAFAETDSDDTAVAEVNILEITPAVLTDETEVSVLVNVSNMTEASGARVSLYMGADSLPTLESVDSFLADGGSVWDVGEIVLSDSEVQDAMTSEGTNLTLTFSVSDLPLWNADDWGAYGAELRVFPNLNGTRVGMVSERTLLLWHAKPSTVSGVNALVSSAWRMPPSDLAPLARPGVTFALQPDQAASTDITGSSQSEIFILPSRAADLSMLATTDQKSLSLLAQQSRSLTEKPAGADWIQDVVLASEDWFGPAVFGLPNTRAVLSTADGIPQTSESELGAKHLVVSSGTGSPTQDVPFILNSFGRISELVSAPNDDARSSFNTEQLIRSTTAIATKLSASSEPQFWVNLDLPPVSNGPYLESIKRRLEALLDVPWVEPTSLESVLDSEPSGTEIDVRVLATSGDTEATKAALEPVDDAASLAMGLIDSTGGAENELAALAQRSLSPTTIGLSPADLKSVAEETVSALLERYDVIEVVPSQSVNITGPSAPFPVTVKNAGEIPVNVSVGIIPDSSLIRANEWVEATVPANSTTTVNVPVIAVGSGDVNVTIQAKTEAGIVLGSNADVLVRSRPGLGDTITWVAGSVFGALFLLGLVRTVRKGRRKVVRLFPEVKVLGSNE